MGGFRELMVWQKGKQLAVAVYKLASEGRFSADYGLRDQLRRAAVSVPSNIAEGDERETNKESIRFFYIAKGSLAEVVTQLEIAQKLGYIPREELILFNEKCTGIGKMLGSLIKARVP